MALPNNSFGVTPGSGETIATELISGKKYGVVQEAGPQGHIIGTRPSYIMIIPPVAGTIAATNKVHFDLFNASGSGLAMHIHGLTAVWNADVAMANNVALRIDLFRTNTVGTGGTVVGQNASTAINTISRIDPGDALLPAQITARVVPTGGAARQAWVGQAFVACEEVATSLTYHNVRENMIRYSKMADVSNMVLPEGFGITAVQGPAAQTAVWCGFRVIFTLV